MKDWADEVIMPVLEKHLDEIGVHASYAIDADENGVTVDLAAESRNDDKGLEEGEDGILDSIVDSVRAAGKGCYRTRVRFKLSDSTLNRRVILG